MPAKAADTLLSLKDGADLLNVDGPSQISTNGDFNWTFEKTTRDQKDQGLSQEWAKTATKTKDAIKMNGQITLLHHKQGTDSSFTSI